MSISDLPFSHVSTSSLPTALDKLQSMQPYHRSACFFRRIQVLGLMFLVMADPLVQFTDAVELPSSAGDFAKSTSEDSTVFLVTLRSGSAIRVEAEDQEWQWTELAANGEFRERTINSRQIKQIFVGKEAISQQVVEIRQLIEQLANDDFLTRETAEKELSSSSSLARFRSLITNQQEHPNLEVRHRISRILEAQKRNFSDARNANPTIDNTYDVLVDLNGEKMSGDLGEWEMVGRFRQQLIRLRREQISKLSRLDLTPEKIESATMVSNRVFQDFTDEFYLPHQTLIDFEETPTGEALVARSDVSQLYVSKGLKLSSEKPGYIGISGYMFRGDSPPSGNSICVFEVGVNTFHRFKGVMEFRFCVPGFPELDAGVHEFGLFAARVDNPRDFILEAYNAEGHLLALVEAADNHSPFFGVKSSEPISFLRLRSNPFLFRLTRKVDEDFCVDDVMFSKPIPLHHLRQSNLAPALLLHQGDLLVGDVTLNDSRVLIPLSDIAPDNSLEIELPIEDVRSIRLANNNSRSPDELSPFPKGDRTWAVMLKDRSVLHLRSAKTLVPKLFSSANDQDDDPLSSDELMAIWLAGNELRYPLAGDFPVSVDLGDNSDSNSNSDLITQSQNAVIVYPTCRIIVEDLEMKATGYQWSAATRKEQDVWIRIRQEGKFEQFGPGGESYEDPNPQLDNVEFSETSSELIPTLWLQIPPERTPRLGLVQLIDGQQIVLGGSAGFELEAIDADGLTIRWKNRSQTIPYLAIVSIDFEMDRQRIPLP